MSPYTIWTEHPTLNVTNPPTSVPQEELFLQNRHHFFTFHCTQDESHLSNKIPSTVPLPFKYNDTPRVRDTERDRK
jgi:hypothetical protein